MGKISKTLALLLTLIIAMSCLTLLTVKPTNAQTIPKPSVPEFTVTFVDRSYTAPITTTQTTDPFSGQQLTHTSGGQYVKNETVDIKIVNPPLTSVTLANGTVEKMYYTIRTKGHFSDYWWSSNVPWTSTATYEGGNSFTRVFASTSDYTVVTLVIGSPNDIIMGYADVYIPAGGQEDFQVEASFGYQYTTYAFLYPTGVDFVSYADSGWSDTQTLTLGWASLFSSDIIFLLILAFLIFAVLIIVICLLIIKRRKTDSLINGRPFPPPPPP